MTIALEEVTTGETEDSGTLRRIREHRPQVTDAAGRFRFKGLSEGTSLLRAEKTGFGVAERQVVLEGSADVGPVAFVLSPSGPGE